MSRTATTVRTARRAAAPAAVLAATVLLASCTIGAEPDDAATDAGGGPVTTSEEPVEPSDPPSPEGPTPDELNADILARAETAAASEPIASVTGTATPQEVRTVLDVLEVRAVDDGTLVRMRLSSPDGDYNVAPTTFASGRFGTQSFVRDVYLDDTAGGTRYLPLQFEDYREACVCPYIPLDVGPEAQEVHALFPALPEGTTVDLSLAGGSLAIEGLTVAGG